MVMRLLLILAIALPVAAQDALVKLAEVWSRVKFSHPYTMQRDLDWDGALVRAIPAVRAAKDDAAVAKAIGAMLAELNDPATRVAARAAKPTGSDVPLFRRDGDLLVINLGPYADAKGEDALWPVDESLMKELPTAKQIVVDLRAKSATDFTWVLSYLPGLVRENVPGVPMRDVYHSGYAPQQGSTSGGYYSGVLTIVGGSLSPRLVPNMTGPAPRVVLVTGDTLRPIAAAMWWNGNAAIVSEKPISADSVGATDAIELSEGHVALIRTNQLAARGLAADAVVPDAQAAMQKAIEIARSSAPFAPRPPLAGDTVTPKRQAEKAYPEMHYPDLPHRLLALFRLWSIIDTFYPYKHLIGDWDAVLREFIPRFEAAKDEQEYAAAVLEAVARIDDGHSFAAGHRAADSVFGAWTFPANVRHVEGQYVVTKKRGNFPAGTPLEVGDVIVSVDGEPIEQRVQRLWKYRTASTEIARRNGVVAAAMRGPKDSVAAIGIRNADGSTRVVNVPRVAMFVPPPEPKGEPYRILDGNIGYVDLERLTPMQVDAMFDALLETKAIIFDMRGYPRGTAWPIAPRINTKKAKVGATFRRVQLPKDREGSSGFFFDQQLPKSDKPVYQGQTLMLIDDRAISQSEHTGLFFEAASGTKFIGSNSAGANGDVTNFTLPGGFTVGFTGHDVRHADGRQLQRIGLVPDVRVEPTIKGIREGKDEVLERAIAYINNGQ